jgi:hypothetical protein
MFKKLIERIDSINDYVNPVVVRDMRSAFGNWKTGAWIVGYSVLLVLPCLLIYFLRGMDSFESAVNEPESVMMGYILGVLGIGFSVFISIIVVCQYALRGLNDEMFLITAMTPRQQLHACMIEMFLFLSFCLSLFVPVILMIWGQSLNFLILTVVVLCVSVLVSQLIILIVLSFIIRLTRPVQAIFLALGLYFCGFPFFPIMLPWFFLDFVWTEYCNWQTIGTSDTFGFVSIYILIPIGLLITGIMAYKLSLHAFAKRGKLSVIKMILLNILYYTLLSAVLALIYFCIAFVVFTFL